MKTAGVSGWCDADEQARDVIEDADAVIREARRRQRRRQFRTGAAVVLALATGLRGYAVVAGHGDPPAARTAGAPGHRPAGGVATVSDHAAPVLPRYYVTAQDWHVFVRRTATGAVTAQLPNPGVPGQFMAMAVAAGASGRDFVAAYQGSRTRHCQSTISTLAVCAQTRLYSFHLTASGRVTGLALVRGGVIDGLEAGPDNAMAISPDGSRVALVVSRPWSLLTTRPAEIVVLNLRTGAHGLWSGGLRRPGMMFGIPSLSWEPGGHSLAFLAQWCRNGSPGEVCAVGPHDAQLRTLRLTAGSGQLSRGDVLLGDSARYPNIVQAVLRPDGASVAAVVLRPPYEKHVVLRMPEHLQVIQLPLAPSGRPQLLYQGRLGGYVAAPLWSDPTGRYLILGARASGWLDHGALHRLAPGATGYAAAW
jgi:hypothetical protein